MKIIQQTSTLLHFRQRKRNDLFGCTFGTGIFIALSVLGLWSFYSQSQYVQLKCEIASSSRSEPCTITHKKTFLETVESEPVKSVRVDTIQNQDSTTTTFNLTLLTAKGAYDFPYSSNEEVEIYRQKIEKMLRSGRVLGTQLEPLMIEKDSRLGTLIFSIVGSLITLLLAFLFIGMISSIPTYADWKFDKNDNSIVSDFYQFSRRIDHDEISLNQVQQIKWTAQTRVSRDDYGRETHAVTFCVELVLRSGKVIPLIPSMWSNHYWTFENSEAFATTISHFLDVQAQQVIEN